MLFIVALAEDGMESASWLCHHLVRHCPVFSGDEIDKLCDHLATALPTSRPRNFSKSPGMTIH
jgi:hypothetical protein